MCIKKELDKRARRGRRRASLQLGFFPGFGSIVVQLLLLLLLLPLLPRVKVQQQQCDYSTGCFFEYSFA